MTETPAFCTSCGQARSPGLAFCTSCGSRFDGAPETVSLAKSPPAPPPVWAPQPAGPGWVQPTPPPANPGRSRRGWAVALCLVLLAGLVGAGALTVVLLRDDPEQAAASTRDDPEREPTGTDTETETATASASPVDTPSSTAGPAEVSPLAIEADFVNQPCSGEFIVMLATEDSPDAYASHLGAAVAGVPNARYLRGADSCQAFVKRGPATGELVYDAYLGPFATLAGACAALSTLSSETAWTRQLSYPSPDRTPCICETASEALPVIGGSDGVTSASSLPVRRVIAQVQWILYEMGINPSRDAIYGHYTAEFDRQVRLFQVQQGLVDRAADGGRIGPQTWTALRDEYCGNPAYDVYR